MPSTSMKKPLRASAGTDMTAPKLPDGLEPVAWSKVRKDHMPRMRMLNEPYLQGVWDVPLVRLSDAQAALQAQAAEKNVEIATLKEALASVKNAGAPLANFAFNLAQHPGRSLNQRECGLIDLCRKDWDAAIDAARVLAAKEAK